MGSQTVGHDWTHTCMHIIFKIYFSSFIEIKLNVSLCKFKVYSVMVCESRSAMSDSLRSHGLSSPWNSPGQNTGVASCSLLQGIFPTQGLNPGLPHCRQILSQLSQQGSSRILEWVAYPFASESSRLRNWTGVSCIASRFFTNWAIKCNGLAYIVKWLPQ